MTGTGENHSGYSLGPLRSRKPYLKKLLYCLPLYPRLRKEFGLYSISAQEAMRDNVATLPFPRT